VTTGGATERLFRAAGAPLDFEARVVAARVLEGAAPSLEVLLDRTAFFPGGGGQPCDRGRLGGAPVTSVRESGGGAIVHVIDAAPGALGAGDAMSALAAIFEAGAIVPGSVDRARRLDLSRHHTGQHLLSAALLRRLDAETVGVHFSDDPAATCSLDLARGPLSDAEVDAAEDLALAILLEDRPVTARVHALSEADSLGLRRPPPASEVTAHEGLRVVTIEGVDVSACCGAHVARTGEIGPIRILGQEKVRGQARLRFVVGGRALVQERLRTRKQEEALEKTLAARRAAEKRGEALEEALAKEVGFRLARDAIHAKRYAPGEAWTAVVTVMLAPEDPRPDWVAGAIAAAGATAVVARYEPGQGGMAVVLSRKEGPGPDLAALGKSVFGPAGAKGGGKASFARFTIPSGTDACTLVHALAGGLSS